MTVIEQKCLLVQCDGCYEDDFGYDHIPHFENVQQLIEFCELNNWVVRTNPDGTIRSVWCEECWAARDEVEKADA